MEYYAGINNTIMNSTVTKPIMTQNYINGVIYEKEIYNFMCNLNTCIYLSTGSEQDKMKTVCRAS